MHFLTRDEIRKLLIAVRNERDRAALCTAYLHGLRVSELILLTAADLREGTLFITRGKKGAKCEQKTVTSPDELFNEADWLPRLAATRPTGEALFGEYRMYWHRVIKEAGQKAGIEARKCHMHVLRHSCAMTCLEAGMGLEKIQRKLGHVSLSSTGHYLHPTDDQVSEEFGKIFE